MHPPALPRHRRRSGADRGQAVGFVLIAVCLIAAIALAAAHLSTRIINRSKAQVAADAAALAAIGGGRNAAVRLAGQNGAVVIAYSDEPGVGGITVTVTVRVGGEQAMARASDEP